MEKKKVLVVVGFFHGRQVFFMAERLSGSILATKESHPVPKPCQSAKFLFLIQVTPIRYPTKHPVVDPFQ